MRIWIPWSLVALLSILLLISWQHDPGATATASATSQSQQPPDGAAEIQQMGARMIEAIRNTEGCLGVRTGDVSGGLNTIFAFFEDREAALRWYHHPMHRGLRGMMGGETPEGFVPLGDVPAGVPVLAVAAISFDGPPADPESRIPFSTISIELYTPVNGGLRINGGFAPDKFAELLQRPDAAEPDAP